MQVFDNFFVTGPKLLKTSPLLFLKTKIFMKNTDIFLYFKPNRHTYLKPKRDDPGLNRIKDLLDTQYFDLIETS